MFLFSIFTINGIIENRSGAFDAAGTADGPSDIPEFNVVGFLLRRSLLIVLNLERFILKGCK